MGEAYLFTHRIPVGAAGTVISGAGYLLKDEGEQDYGKHWTIVVQFDGEETVVLCELIRDTKSEKSAIAVFGTITYRCLKLKPQELIDDERKSRRIYHLGRIDVTEETLRSLCDQITINQGNYNLFYRNCQVWARALCDKLNLTRMFCLSDTKTDAGLPMYNYEQNTTDVFGIVSEPSVGFKITTALQNAFTNKLKGVQTGK